MSDPRSGRGGIPDWLEPMMRFCSRCGGALAFGPIEDEERERLACPKCGLVCYVNPRLVVTTLPVTESGEVMLIRRGIAPGIGQWAQPGGFLEIDETVRDAAIRETLEETGLLVEPGAIVGLYSGVPAAVVVVAFEARVVGGTQRTTREALETLAFAPDAIPWDKIAFETSVRALRDWVARVRPDLPLPDPSTLNRPFGG
jgi:ADP-ribose pyrophosphatase YjhB (NUDIX family)